MSGEIRPLDRLELPEDRRVIVRADLNLPCRDGRVQDRFRLERLLPTLRELTVGRGARLAILSHFGQPGGRGVPEMSLGQVAPLLAEALGTRVGFAPDCVGAQAGQAVASLAPGEMMVLENLRFHPGEEAEDPQFAGALAALGGVYVNDAFSCCHRAHASITRLAGLLPAFGGRGLVQELARLEAILDPGIAPRGAVAGGAKVSSKLAVLRALLRQLDFLCIGGAMANTFLAADGCEVGRSLIEPALVKLAAEMLAGRHGKARIVLPEDVVVAEDPEQPQTACTVPVGEIPPDRMVLDIGPATLAAWQKVLEPARLVVWNGPLGLFEVPPFDQGTLALARLLGQRTRDGGLVSIAGGGDSVAALRQSGQMENFSWVSTAGGAFLEWLEGRELPGIRALRRP